MRGGQFAMQREIQAKRILIAEQSWKLNVALIRNSRKDLGLWGGGVMGKNLRF